MLRRVGAETAAARTESTPPSAAPGSAEVDRRIAARLVDESGWRGRRHARQRLADAGTAVNIARSTLDQVGRATAPHRERYRDAFDASKQADGELRRHQLSRMLRPDKSPDPLQQRVAALETWRRWADDEPVAVAEFADATAQLRSAVRNYPTGRLRQLCDPVHLVSLEIAVVPSGARHPLRRAGPSPSM